MQSAAARRRRSASAPLCVAVSRRGALTILFPYRLEGSRIPTMWRAPDVGSASQAVQPEPRDRATRCGGTFDARARLQRSGGRRVRSVGNPPAVRTGWTEVVWPVAALQPKHSWPSFSCCRCCRTAPQSDCRSTAAIRSCVGTLAGDQPDDDGRSGRPSRGGRCSTDIGCGSRSR